MKDVKKSININGVIYPLVFNLNVMERVQHEYGSVELWGDYTDGTYKGKLEYEAKHGEGSWDDLDDNEKLQNKGEPDARSIIFGFCEMINEGIDIENEEKNETRGFITTRQAGRLITTFGLDKASEKLAETVIESQKIENEETKNV